jgi:hypothetical protein
MRQAPERDTTGYRRFAPIAGFLHSSETMLRAANIGPVQRPFRKALRREISLQKAHGLSTRLAACHLHAEVRRYKLIANLAVRSFFVFRPRAIQPT